MRSEHLLTSVDFHTAGIGVRLLTAGVPRVPGATMADKRRHFEARLDWIRTGLCLPPRGHAGMLVAVLTEPVSSDADFGLLFMYPDGYYVSCGEATLGAATVAVETGLVARLGAETPVVIDTEAGTVRATARSDGARVREVTIRWLPSYVALPDAAVKLPELGEVALDVVVGVGNVFAVVEAARLGVAVRRDAVPELAARGMAVRHAIAEQLRVEVPGLGRASVDNVLIHVPPDAEGVSPNALVWGPGQVDPAPCGSGTCARMALLHHRGRMRVGDAMISEGILGMRFTGRIAAETFVAGRRAIVPEITGTSHLTGTSQFLFDPDDPVREGYLL